MICSHFLFVLENKNDSNYYLFDMETETNVALYYQYKSLIYRFSEIFPINPIDNLIRQKVTFNLESPCELDYE